MRAICFIIHFNSLLNGGMKKQLCRPGWKVMNDYDINIHCSYLLFGLLSLQGRKTGKWHLVISCNLLLNPVFNVEEKRGKFLFQHVGCGMQSDKHFIGVAVVRRPMGFEFRVLESRRHGYQGKRGLLWRERRIFYDPLECWRMVWKQRGSQLSQCLCSFIQTADRKLLSI